jgi:hypothetical protein
MVTTDSQMVWHNDGHIIHLQINKSNLEILSVHCPHIESSDAPCRHPEAKCVVKWFVETFGMECNVGVCKPTDELGVAWTFVGESHKELTACQVWIIPTEDEAFSAWMVTQN